MFDVCLFDFGNLKFGFVFRVVKFEFGCLFQVDFTKF